MPHITICDCIFGLVSYWRHCLCPWASHCSGFGYMSSKFGFSLSGGMVISFLQCYYTSDALCRHNRLCVSFWVHVKYLLLFRCCNKHLF